LKGGFESLRKCGNFKKPTRKQQVKIRNMIKTKYVMKKIVLDKKTLQKFYMDNASRRQIRNGQVNQLKKHLLSGGHFSSPLVVNEINDRNKLIDGNHRTEAITDIISTTDKDFSIEVWVAIYKNLTVEEEREVYSEWNKGVRQSASDFLKSHWDSIPLRKELLSRLPVSIYGSKNTMPIKSFVGNQIFAKREREHFEGGYSNGIFQVVDDFRNLELVDIDLLDEFYSIISKVLGEYYDKVPFYTTTSLGALYRIWYDNRDRISKQKFVKAFAKVIDFKSNALKEDSKAGGRNATLNFYNTILTRLNRYSVKFLSDIEAFEERKIQNADKEKIKKIVGVVKKN